MDGTTDGRSRLLLGGDHRLAVAAAIASFPAATFKTSSLVDRTGLSAELVSREIKHFREAKVLRKVAHGEHERCFERFWQGCADILADDAESAGGGRETGPSTSTGPNSVVDLSARRARPSENLSGPEAQRRGQN